MPQSLGKYHVNSYCWQFEALAVLDILHWSHYLRDGHNHVTRLNPFLVPFWAAEQHNACGRVKVLCAPLNLIQNPGKFWFYMQCPERRGSFLSVILSCLLRKPKSVCCCCLSTLQKLVKSQQESQNSKVLKFNSYKYHRDWDNMAKCSSLKNRQQTWQRPLCFLKNYIWREHKTRVE